MIRILHRKVDDIKIIIAYLSADEDKIIFIKLSGINRPILGGESLSIQAKDVFTNYIVLSFCNGITP